MDLPRIERAVREILEAIGEDPSRPGLVETPARVARMYQEICGGLEKDPMGDMKIFHEPDSEEMILVGNIPFYSLCEHHLLPFIGQAHVIYLPKNGNVLGLSKVARVVDTVARRPQVQERMTSMVADALMEGAKPYGVYVVLEAEHLCMTMRGIKKPGSKTVTSAVRGICKTNLATRTEALSLINNLMLSR